jgi:hypothetical protein
MVVSSHDCVLNPLTTSLVILYPFSQVLQLKQSIYCTHPYILTIQLLPNNKVPMGHDMQIVLVIS